MECNTSRFGEVGTRKPGRNAAEEVRKMSDILIFITATIHPGKTINVRRNNPEQRSQDYLQGLTSWMDQNCDADILFCENSNGDLTSHRAAAQKHLFGKRVRFLSFAGNEGAQKWGKGYGELEMLDHAFGAMPQILNYRYIVKVSGRYQIKNGAELVQRIARMNADLICDMHANLTYGDSKTMAFTPQAIQKHLVPFRGEHDEANGVCIEHLVARCVHRTLLAGGTWAPLPCTPYAEGMSGTWNTPERSTLIWRLKQNFKRQIARWIYRH
jgi:hypothetical protein